MAIHQYKYKACDASGKTEEGQLNAESQQEV
jgi:type II secretory pathway component PulF